MTMGSSPPFPVAGTTHAFAPFTIKMGPCLIGAKQTARIFWKADRAFRASKLVVTDECKARRYFLVTALVMGKREQICVHQALGGRGGGVLPALATMFEQDNDIGFGETGKGTDAVPVGVTVALEVRNQGPVPQDFRGELHGTASYWADDPQPSSVETTACAIEAEFIERRPTVTIEQSVLDTWLERLETANNATRPTFSTRNMLSQVIAEMRTVRTSTKR
jgi:hypothetical protein